MNKNQKLNLAKSISFALVISLGCIYLIYDSNSLEKISNDYQLITQEKATIKGKIIEAEEFENVIESNDSRTVDIAYGYTYSYQFTLPSGVLIESEGGNYGELPAGKQLNDIPYEVDIEYLPENPQINRIKNLWSNNETLLELFRTEILLKLVVLLVCLYLSFISLKKSIRTYKETSETC